MIVSTKNKVIKTNLAKLMATENITVEYGSHETAAFDTKNRKLLLPNWSHKSNDVHDLLVGHEVGHALFTPSLDDENLFTDIDAERPMMVHQYMNVVEDARIERDIKSKFPGLKRSFFSGYETLLEDDVFKLEDRDISEMNLIDRINLFFKVGNHIRVPFSDDEKPFLSRIEKTDSFDDVMSIVKDLYEFAKSQAEEKLSEMGESETADHDYNFSDDDSGNSGLGDTENPDGPDSNESGNSDGSGEESDETGNEGNMAGDDDSSTNGSNSSSNDNDNGKTLDEIMESETEKSLSDSISNMVERNSNVFDDVVPSYYYIPNVNAKDFTVSLGEVHRQIESYYNNYGKKSKKEEFTKFKRDNTKMVNYMVKEFELKKNAEQMSRASVSKTGVIDVNKLHSYKFNDDLFRRVTTIPGGKNHGMVMFLDWSGSMSDSISHVIRQSMILAMFCKKVGIPFHLYGFTDNCMSYDEHGDEMVSPGVKRYGVPHVKYQDKDLTLKNFRLREYLNSSLNTKNFDKAMYNLFTLAESFEANYWSHVPSNEELSSTPLNEAIIVAHDLIPKIKSYYKLEKVTSIWLTDGDSNINDQKYYDDPDMADTDVSRYSNSSRIMVNRKTRKQYLANNRREMTNALLESLGDSLNLKQVGFFVVANGGDMRSARQRIRYTPENEKTFKALGRTKSAIFTDIQGYDEWYIIKGGKDLDTSTTDQLQIDRGSKKGKITTAFKRHSKNRTRERVIMNSLVNLMA